MSHPATSSSGWHCQYRIQNIEVQTPTVAKQKICAWLLVDGTVAYKLPFIERGMPLTWQGPWYCDAKPTPTIELQIYREPYFGHKLCLRSSIVFSASELSNRCFFRSIEQSSGVYSASFTIVHPAIEELPVYAENAITRSKNARVALMSISQFSKSAFRDCPTTANAAIKSCWALYQTLESKRVCTEDIEQLILKSAKLLERMESVIPRTSSGTRITVIASTIELICRLVDYIATCVSALGPGQLTEGLMLASRGKIKTFLEGLAGLKNRAQNDWIDRALDMLQTAPCCSNDGNRNYLPSICATVISAICAWCQQDEDTPSDAQFLWVRGTLGLGKTSVIASVCSWLEARRLLGAKFFSKWDSLELRDPRIVLQTIVHGLTKHSDDYKRLVAAAIYDNPDTHKWSLQLIYERLIRLPFLTLNTSGATLEPTCVVVDGLDECGTKDSSAELFSYLHSMTRVAPWVKIIVACQPNAYVQGFFDGVAGDSVKVMDLADYHELGDVHQYICDRIALEPMGSQQLGSSASALLAKHAGSSLTWADIACSFILPSTNQRKRLEQVLSTHMVDDHAFQFDSLYRLFLEKAMMKKNVDESRLKKQWLGAIITTNSRAPLSANALKQLLGPGLDPKLLDDLIEDLSPILRTDPAEYPHGAIRILHQSFVDYLTSQSRSGHHYVDSMAQDRLLSACCLRALLAGLKFNICELETSYTLNRDVLDLEPRVAHAINPSLRYSCQYWISHLTTMKSIGSDEEKLLNEFMFGRSLFYWIEALSLLRKLHTAVPSLRVLSSWATVAKKFNDVSKCAQDASHLISNFYTAISTSTPHLYISALGFDSGDSLLVKRGRLWFPNTFRVTGAPIYRYEPTYHPETSENTEQASGLSCGHDSYVLAVAFSPDGRRIVSGSTDKTMRLWDAKTGASDPKLFIRHSSAVLSVSFSPNGDRIVSGSSDRTARIWDATTGAPLSRPFIGHSDWVASVGFSPNGHRIVTGSYDDSIRLWNAETGTSQAVLLIGASAQAMALSVAFSPDGRHIVSGSSGNVIQLWDAGTGAPLGNPLCGHSGWVTSVAFSPNGQHVVSGSSDRTIQIWNIKADTRSCAPLSGHTDEVNSVAFSPDGRHIASGSHDTTVRLWCSETGTPLTSPFVGHTGIVWSVAFSPDGQRIVSGSSDSTIRIWAVEQNLACLGVGLPSNIMRLLPFLHSDGWISLEDKTCMFWLPDAQRPKQGQRDDSLLCISKNPARSCSRVLVDYSRFFHGAAWTLVSADQHVP